MDRPGSAIAMTGVRASASTASAPRANGTSRPPTALSANRSGSGSSTSGPANESPIRHAGAWPQRRAGGRVLLSDMATLGGGQGLAGFDPGRFHDLNSVLGRLSYIFPLSSRLEFDLHTEVGQVAGTLQDVGVATLRQSYGIALRPRLDDFVLGMIGVDWSREAVRFRFSVGGVE